MPLHSDPISYPPRGLSREEAARYVGVSPTTFDRMIVDRQMPKPKLARGRNVWDRAALDMAFTALPNQDGGNYFDR
jgi:excisionase family DNA binding protein